MYAEFRTDLSEIPVVLAMVFSLTYMISVLDRANRSGLLAKIAPEVVGALPVANAVTRIVVSSALVWVALDSLPMIGGILSHRSLTLDFAETYSAHFAALFEVRYDLAVLALLIGIALTLPGTLGTSLRRFRFLMSAVLFSASAYFAWGIASSLSHLSHAYTLAGVSTASGLLSLALTQLAGHATTSSNLTVAEFGGWLSESKIRGFILGVVVSYYGLLLHPVLHEVMQFAAFFEYMAVLLLLMFMLLRFRSRVRVEVGMSYLPPLDWPNWSHHEQRLATKSDPRAVGMRDLENRLKEGTDWRPMFTYLLGLLYRNEAPLENAEAVCRAMRRTLIAPKRRFLPWKRGGQREKWADALMECLATVEEGMASAGKGSHRVDEAFIRHAAEEFIQTGTYPERPIAALMLAYYLKSGDIGRATSSWSSLPSERTPSPAWYVPPWIRSRSMARGQARRARIVDDAITFLFSETPRQPEVAPPMAVAAAL